MKYGKTIKQDDTSIIHIASFPYNIEYNRKSFLNHCYKRWFNFIGRNKIKEKITLPLK
jgi:hypothetical protein